MLSLQGKSEASSYLRVPDQRDRGFRILRGAGSAQIAPVARPGSGHAEKVESPGHAVLQQLDHMLRSRLFVQSEKLSRFLRFIVEQVLDGKQNRLKEYVIGSEVYDRRPPYHPSQDSIVRTEARRLRTKLKEYYETEGKEDSVHISLRPGSYAPIFQSRETLAGGTDAFVVDVSVRLEKATPLVVAILPFCDISQSLISSRFARGIPEELRYTLMGVAGCKVVSSFSVTHCSAPEQNTAALMRKVGADIALEGSVRIQGNQVRVTTSAVDVDGAQVWTKRVDTDAGLQILLSLEEQIACELTSELSTMFRNHPCRRS